MKLPSFVLIAFLCLTISSLNATIEIQGTTPIILSPNAPEPIKLAAANLQQDMADVFGSKHPKLAHEVAPIGISSIIVTDGSLEIPGLSYRKDVTGWEAHAVYVTKDESGTPHVILHGSDIRGQIFAIYTFAEEVLGVPPLAFWSSWQPSIQNSISIPLDHLIQYGPPHVKWRAGYPNDQRQLSRWRRLNDEQFRDKHFETFLRLKLNTFHVIWSMESSFNRPNRLLRDVEIAQKHGMVTTNAHSLGAHPGRERWENFWRNIRGMDEAPERSLNNQEAYIDFWRYHVEAKLYHDVEILHGLGFRGAGDVGFWQRDNFEDPGTDQGRAKVIETILHKQVDLVKEVTGEEAPLMVYTLYTENCDFVAAGYLVPPQEPNLIYKFSSARRDHFPPQSLLIFNFSENQKVGYYFNSQFTSTGSHIVQGEGPHKMEMNYRIADAKSPMGLSASWINAGNVRERLMEIAAHARMMWDFESYDSSSYLREFSGLYFGQDHAEEIAQLFEDFFNAYWQQKEPDLEGFDRQYIFQDLRIHRVMRTLSPMLAERNHDLNPFLEGDWFRIDPAFNGVETEIEAVIVGLGTSAKRLRELAFQADALYLSLEPQNRPFFNSQLRLQIYFLLYTSETAYHLANAMLAGSKEDEESRTAHINLAYASLSKVEPVLRESEFGVFANWYNPVRDRSIGSVYHLDVRLREIRVLKN